MGLIAHAPHYFYMVVSKVLGWQGHGRPPHLICIFFSGYQGWRGHGRPPRYFKFLSYGSSRGGGVMAACPIFLLILFL